MKFHAPTSALNTSLSLVTRAVPSKPTYPILGNVLLTASSEAQQVRLTAFDLTLGIETSFEAQVDAPGKITLPAKLLTNTVSHLPAGELTLDVGQEFSDNHQDNQGDHNQLFIATITSESGRYQIRGMDAQEFPQLPAIEGGTQITVPAFALKEGLSGTLFAASDNETKQVLCGVHLTLENNTIEFASTDGHRLAVIKTSNQVESNLEVTTDPNEDSTDLKFEVTVPAKALQELEKLLGNTAPDTVIALWVQDNQVLFQGNSTLTTRTLEGQYPAYHQLIPRQFNRQMNVSRLQFLAAVERVAVMASQKNNIIKLDLDSENQQLTLSIDAADVGSSLEVLPVQLSGESLSIAFNVKYLKEAIKAIPASEVKVQLNNDTSPVVLSPVVLSQNIMAASMLLMPVQITHQTAANEPQKTPAKQQSKTKTSPKKKQREPKLAAV
jgi:DNA polymerase-3 subunit beta